MTSVLSELFRRLVILGESELNVDVIGLESVFPLTSAQLLIVKVCEVLSSIVALNVREICVESGP